METQFHCGSILEDIYYGYNMNSNNVFPDEENAPRTRTRKVTLTEITDEFNDVLDSDIPEEINANDAFQALDEGIKEWKSRLEQVVTDGLKKLKKNLKEKKLMVKYIPGVNCGKDELGILNEAKLQAIRGCELDNGKIMRDIQRRVDRIFQVANPKSHFIERMDNNNINQHKKKLININCAAGGGLDNFKELLKSIGSLTESSPWTLKNNTIPIYSPNCDLKDKYALVTRGCTDVLPAYNRWFFNDIIMNPIIQSQKKDDILSGTTQKVHEILP
ncbi:uncharacterized protein [Lepeophtheirus salmonis]|uniref:uncharacterized protein n=1 Tax=Lepeophtheirus salmonis TaxID=72036 RepID=UPI001AE802CB|nr:uncharacterized protein LOC121115118 [Lepeophtheirus salmonis]